MSRSEGCHLPDATRDGRCMSSRGWREMANIGNGRTMLMRKVRARERELKAKMSEQFHRPWKLPSDDSFCFAGKDSR